MSTDTLTLIPFLERIQQGIKRKYESSRNNAGRAENMHYDDQNDCYICPNGKTLNYAYDSHSKTASGYTVTQKNYICESCSGCPHRDKCFKGQYENRKIRISQTMARQKENAERLITSYDGILLRMNRSIQV